MKDIQKLAELKFYSKDGNMIYAQKDFVITWKLIPTDEVAPYFHEVPEGYFMGDVDEQRKLVNDSMVSGNIRKGKVYCDKYTFLKAGFNPKEYMLDMYAAKGNMVRITVNVNERQYSHDFDIKAVFDLIHPDIEVEMQ